MVICRRRHGTDIKGIQAFVSSAKIEEPDLVIAKFIFGNSSSRLSIKLKVSKSICAFS